MTTTDINEIDDVLVRKANVYRIDNGNIIERIVNSD